VILDCV